MAKGTIKDGVLSAAPNDLLKLNCDGLVNSNKEGVGARWGVVFCCVDSTLMGAVGQRLSIREDS